MKRLPPRERLAQDLGLITLQAASEQTTVPLPVLRRWIQTGRLPVFLVGRERFLCPELVAQIAHARAEIPVVAAHSLEDPDPGRGN